MGRRDCDGAKERFWREAVRRQRTSGLTIRAFRRREDRPEHGFDWRRRRRELECRRAPRQPPRGDVRGEPSSTARFVPVTVTSASSAVYEVHLPSRVRVQASTNEQPRDVLAALERLAC